MANNRRLKLRLKKIFSYIKGPLQRLLTAVLVTGLVAVIGLLVYNNPPNQWDYSTTSIDDSNPFTPRGIWRPWDANFNYSVLIDIHHHPNGLDPDTLIKWFISAGYNAVVLTEHNTIDNSLQVQRVAREKYPDFKVLIGMEWTNCRMHMGLLGINSTFDVPKNPTDEQIQDLIAKVHAQGGLVVVNHPPWSYWAGLNSPSNEELVSWGVDFFDVTTDVRLDLQLIYFAQENKVGYIAGTDMHELGTAHEWTLLDVPAGNITEASVMDALRSKKTSFIFDEVGFQPPVTSSARINPYYNFAYPWIIVGQLFHSFYEKATGQYSFVDGYCGFGEKIIIHDKEIWTAVFWMLAVWLMLESFCGLITFGIKKIHRKLHPNRAKLLDDEGEQMDVWDAYL